MGKYVDYYFQNNRLKNIINMIIRKHYCWIPQKDYDDFYSIGGQTLWYCEKRFDSSKGKNFEKYLIDSLHRKIKTQITHMNRKKRNSGIPDMSIEKIICEENDLTYGDFIAEQNDEFEIDPLVQRYLDSLTKSQRRVAELYMDGYDGAAIKKILCLTDERFNTICKMMRFGEKIEPLNKFLGRGLA